MTRFKKILVIAASALALVACANEMGGAQNGRAASGRAQAQGQERVIVTAQKREETTQDAALGVMASASEVANGPPAPPPIAGATYAQMAPQPMPGEVNRETYEDVRINGAKQVALEPVSTFSIDVDTASYANVRRMLNAGHLPPKDAVRIEEMIKYFDYAYDRPASKRRPFDTTVKIAPSPWAPGRKLMHVAVQGYDIKKDQRPPLNLTLLIDVSGSMSAQNKLPLAIQSLKLLVNELTPVGSNAALIDPSRYQEGPAAKGKSNEFGFLKVRYKLPGEDV